MRSWTNATPPEAPATALPGVLRPDETARLANLHRGYPVADRLRPFVERYWSVRWDLTGRPAHVAEVLSDPCVNVSVESGTEPRFGHPLPAVLVHAVVTRRFSVTLRGLGRVTAAKFRPGGFAAFTGASPPPNSVTPAAGALGVAPEAVVAAVLRPDDDAARAAALDTLLAPLAPEPDPAYLELQDLLAVMAADRDLVRVQDVAARTGLGVRGLQRLFAAYVGVGPKAVLARYRLQDAVAAIDAGQAEDLAELAAALGWYDQAHFSREFRAVVGTTPSEYLRQARAALWERGPVRSGGTAGGPGPGSPTTRRHRWR